MTLDGSCNPWIVPAGDTNVSGTSAPVLTIGAGVNVAFQPGASLIIGPDKPGAIVAVGNASAHITFTSAAAHPASGDWSSVALADNTLSTSTIAFVDFDYGGGPGDWNGSEPQAPLLVYSSSDNDLTPTLHDITIAHNAGNGVVFNGLNVGFGPGSGSLMVNDWANGDAPFAIWANAAGARDATFPGLPTSLMTPANGGGFVNLIAGAGGQNGGAAVVQVTQTWPSIPLPYYAYGTGANGGGLQVEGPSSLATLTIDAPNTIEFDQGGALEVDPAGTSFGRLIAVGTTTAGLTFTSHAASPAPGDWAGILFSAPNGGGSQLSNTMLEYAKIDYAGSGGNPDLTFDNGTATLGITGLTKNSAGPIISNCTVENYPANACGLLIQPSIVLPTGGYTNNTFIPASGGACTISQQ